MCRPADATSPVRGRCARDLTTAKNVGWLLGAGRPETISRTSLMASDSATQPRAVGTLAAITWLSTWLTGTSAAAAISFSE